jgi:hypothetical protein
MKSQNIFFETDVIRRERLDVCRVFDVSGGASVFQPVRFSHDVFWFFQEESSYVYLDAHGRVFDHKENRLLPNSPLMSIEEIFEMIPRARGRFGVDENSVIEIVAKTKLELTPWIVKESGVNYHGRPSLGCDKVRDDWLYDHPGVGEALAEAEKRGDHNKRYEICEANRIQKITNETVIYTSRDSAGPNAERLRQLAAAFSEMVPEDRIDDRAKARLAKLREGVILRSA